MKKLALLLISAAFALLLAEALVRALHLFADERAATHVQQPSSPAGRSEPGRFLLHPFLGYAGNPAFERGPLGGSALSRTFPDGPSAYYRRNSAVNRNGFPSEYPDYADVEDGFHVGIFGGSVAEQLAIIGGEALIAELERRAPELRGRVRIVNGAIGGYKQPQQLISLILLTLQGVRFDAIVNLDGFNEVALSSTDASQRYNPLFPSRIQYLPLLHFGPDPSAASTIEGYADVIRTRRRASALRAAADGGLVGRSELARAVTGIAILWLEANASDAEQEIQQDASPPPSLAAYQPACLQKPEEGCLELIARTWETSSLQMGAIARQIGARYVHALQPNQYDEGSKPFTEHERAIAYLPDTHWASGVQRGYPLLRARIPEMRARGVPVLDLAPLFARVRDDVYVDSCCHYNLRGNSLLAAAIADAILAAGRPPEPTSP